MPFIKGHPVYLKHHSEETKQRMREKALSDGRKPVQPKGYKHSEETRQKMRDAKRANPQTHWRGRSRANQVTPEYRKKVSFIMKRIVAEGKHNFWKGGKTKENKLARSRFEYKLWREAVFERDDWTCQECKIRGGRLEAHHIRPFALFPELRFAIDNGLTLCKPCHKKTDSYGNRLSTKLLDTLSD